MIQWLKCLAATSVLAEGWRSLVLSRETDSKSGKTAETEKVRQLLRRREVLSQAAEGTASIKVTKEEEGMSSR